MIFVIGGTTGVGKSEVACCVAKRVGGEIVSADSMAVYRHMDIGTAKPRECMLEVPHHLIDILEPGEIFDAKIFEREATRSIKDIEKRGKVPIVVGGTYLYIQALLYGIEETPEPNWDLRERLYRVAEKRGSHYLYEKLRAVDPEYAKKIHPRDTRRVVRALEVFIETGRPFSSFHRWNKPRVEYEGFFLTRSWEEISARIEKRVRKMIDKGLVDEVRSLIEMGFEGFLTSSQAIGYKELLPYLKGEVTLEEAVEEIIKNTKRYAKRQVRWFRKQGWREINLDTLGESGACEEIAEVILQRA